jgi:hypothetical protein
MEQSGFVKGEQREQQRIPCVRVRPARAAPDQHDDHRNHHGMEEHERRPHRDAMLAHQYYERQRCEVRQQQAIGEVGAAHFEG